MSDANWIFGGLFANMYKSWIFLQLLSPPSFHWPLKAPVQISEGLDDSEWYQEAKVFKCMISNIITSESCGGKSCSATGCQGSSSKRFKSFDSKASWRSVTSLRSIFDAGKVCNSLNNSLVKGTKGNIDEYTNARWNLMKLWHTTDLGEAAVWVWALEIPKPKKNGLHPMLATRPSAQTLSTSLSSSSPNDHVTWP